MPRGPKRRCVTRSRSTRRSRAPTPRSAACSRPPRARRKRSTPGRRRARWIRTAATPPTAGSGSARIGEARFRYFRLQAAEFCDAGEFRLKAETTEPRLYSPPVTPDPVRRVIGAAVGLALLAGPLPVRTQPQTPMAEMIAGYADWAAGRRASTDVDVVDLDAARRELGRLDPSSIPVDKSWTPDQAREMRRRVLTSFALELAAIGSRRHAASAARLAEWACAYVRSHAPLNDFDRAWQLAALSVLEGGIDSRALADHVAHAQPVFHDEPRLTLARGIAEEQFNAPSEAIVRTEAAASLSRAREALTRAEGESFRASERAVARFQEAAREDSIAAEA